LKGKTMDVYNFCELATDDGYNCAIYDMNTSVEQEVFRGTLREARDSDFSEYDVMSFDLDDGVIILNIET